MIKKRNVVFTKMRMKYRSKRAEVLVPLGCEQRVSALNQV